MAESRSVRSDNRLTQGSGESLTSLPVEIMPAYRSDAEAEVRDAVVAHLRQHRPDARIMHEVNASSFGNRIDVLAVDRSEIIAVEVKSAKDKLDRLPDQLKAMRGVAHHSIAALHEKFLVPTKCGAHAAHFEKGGEHFYGAVPHFVGWRQAWIYPVRGRAMVSSWHDDLLNWHMPEPALQKPLPAGAIDMLWAAELRDMCARFSVSTSPRATMEHRVNALRWQLSGRDLTIGICAALRSRKCIEADPEIEWSMEA